MYAESHHQFLMISRKEFIRNACSIGCFCGFTGMSFATTKETDSTTTTSRSFYNEWIEAIVQSLGEYADEKIIRTVVKKGAHSHYKHLEMDKQLEPFVGKPQQFLKFLEEEWGWKISYKQDQTSLLADENKSVCVCPLLRHDSKNKNLGAMCYCSEGFAELMFSKVYQHPIKAKVIESIHRGNPSCKYQLTI